VSSQNIYILATSQLNVAYVLVFVIVSIFLLPALSVSSQKHSKMVG